jgi:hypothetical protein
MDKLVILHHTKVDLPQDLDVIEYLAGYTHMLNMKSELPNARFISFAYLKNNQFVCHDYNFAPWLYFKWLSVLGRLFFLINVLIKNDKIIIYHSEGFYYYFPLFILFKKKIILQVNEIYSVVTQNHFKLSIEKKYFNIFEKIIVTNINLKNNLFKNKKILLRGGYFRFQKNDITARRNTLNKFIYVGSVDDIKMGNYSLLLNLILTIPDDAYLDLCLISSDSDFTQLKNAIKDKSNIRLFRNVKEGDLINFYKDCKFGLVLQDSKKPFNTTSFPSKIFSYINNGITPIAQKNTSFLNSEINELFYYIDEWTWPQILNAKIVKQNIERISLTLKNELHQFIYN